MEQARSTRWRMMLLVAFVSLAFACAFAMPQTSWAAEKDASGASAKAVQTASAKQVKKSSSAAADDSKAQASSADDAKDAKAKSASTDKSAEVSTKDAAKTTASEKDSAAQSKEVDAKSTEDKATEKNAASDTGSGVGAGSPEKQKADERKASTTAVSSQAEQTVQTAQADKNVTKAKKKDTKTTKPPFANGVYYVESKKNLSVVLDVSGGNKSAGGNVIVYNARGTKNQQWRLGYDAKSGCYTIANVNSGLYLDVSGASGRSGANVIQWSRSSGAANQLWRISGSEQKGYTIASALNKAGSLVLDTASASAASGDNVRMGSKSSKRASQRWWVLAANPYVAPSDAAAQKKLGSTRAYTIVPKEQKSRAVEIYGDIQGDGSNVVAGTARGVQKQTWVLVRDAKGYYSILSAASAKALDIAYGAPTANANVVQWANSGATNQKWSARLNDDGTFSFVSKKTGMALTAAKSSKGVNVRMGFDRGLASQHFRLESARLLADGLYTITTVKNGKQSLDVGGSSTAVNAKVDLWRYNGGLNQKFEVVNRKEGRIAIRAAHSGKYLTAGSLDVVQQPGSPSLSHLWEPVWCSQGIMLVNAGSGKALDVFGGHTSNGTRVITYKKSGEANQRFNILPTDPIDDGLYTIRSLTGSRLLDVAGESTAAGANVDIWKFTNKKNQKYYVERVGGYYKILNAGSKMVVAQKGSNVIQTNWNGADAQLWEARVSAFGGIVFVNKKSGRAMEVAGGRDADGANVAGAKVDEGARAQRWIFAETSVLLDYQQRALNKVLARGSKTDWYIVTNITNHRLMVFHREDKNSDWELYDEWTVATGIRDQWGGRSRTPCKDGKVSDHNLTNGPGGTWQAWYWTFWGGTWYHSILYRPGTKIPNPSNQLGRNISNGCIRCPEEKAEWIYYNIPEGTSTTTWE